MLEIRGKRGKLSMDLRRFVVLGLWLWQVLFVSIVSGNLLFEVEHKFKGKQRSLTAMKAHDAHRHGRMLEVVDLSLGGNGNPSDSGLYFTKIRLGNPSNDYYVQVDTGSDILWVNCAGCVKCPLKSDLGVKLTLFDPKSSNTSKLVGCDADQCSMIYSGTLSGCKSDTLCYYEVTYGDGSSTSGYFVEDYFHYDKVTGNLQTTSGNASVVFGCGAKQGGQLSSSGEALDGIIGFGQANSSVLSQLSSAKKMKKVFSHCLDGINGGGIFAIGEIVEPKLNTTPMVPQQAHYTISMKSVEVAGSVMQFSSNTNAIIDSGTTLAYVPNELYQRLTNAITSQQPSLKLHTVEEQFQCFQYSEDVDEGFPTVKFHFEKSLSFSVYPHEYLFQIRDDVWCIGWQNSDSQSKDGSDIILLGDLVLSNKLVVYDLENQAIGWTDYNCSSSIKVKDSTSGVVHTVGAHDISKAYHSKQCNSIMFFLLLLTILSKIKNH
ncbi:hypothetical protein V2J09_007731 [Rumex salicifolius]